jgi:hypothetical protein
MKLLLNSNKTRQLKQHLMYEIKFLQAAVLPGVSMDEKSEDSIKK